MVKGINCTYTANVLDPILRFPDYGQSLPIFE